MLRCFFLLLFVLAFTEAKLQNKAVDSLSQPQLLTPEQINQTEKVFRPEMSITKEKNQELDCEETQTTEAVNSIIPVKTSQERIAQYKKMIIELKGEKNKLESKGQNSSEIDKKIEKLQTLILNLSK